MSSNCCVEDFDIIKFQDLPTDSQHYISCKEWILSMDEEQDDETGIDYWEWIEINNDISMNDPLDILNTFCIFSKDNPNKVVATGSIVKDDRNMGEKLGLGNSIWIAGINVHRDLRGKGIGKFLFNHIDNAIQVKLINQDIFVYLRSNNSFAKNIYQKFGFKSKGFIQEDYSITENHDKKKSIKKELDEANAQIETQQQLDLQQQQISNLTNEVRNLRDLVLQLRSKQRRMRRKIRRYKRNHRYQRARFLAGD